MSDILTVTLNPCVDVSTATEKVEAIHKLRCEAPRREPGGGGVNVARVLRRLGADCTAVYPAGGVTGDRLDQLLTVEQVPHVRLPIAGETRESFHVRDRSVGQEYRFVMPGPTLSEGEWQACLQHIESRMPRPRYLVVSGSLPPGVPVDFYARLARWARANGVRLVLDASGPALAAALQEGVYLVKPSLRELRELSGAPLTEAAQWRAAAQQWVASRQAELLVLSLGSAGALLVSRQEVLSTPGLAVPVRSAVGAGDSLVGGMVSALAGGGSVREAFRFGVAAATASLLQPGTGLCQLADVRRLQVELIIS